MIMMEKRGEVIDRLSINNACQMLVMLGTETGNIYKVRMTSNLSS
jgi:hypothetical protein